MNKKIVGIFICILLIFTILPASANIIVDRTNNSIMPGNTLYVGGSGEGNYTRIQDAINDSNDGDIVFVYNGVYYENVEINKSITLKGQNKNNTIIDGGGVGNVFYITGESASINGFTIQKGGASTHDDFAGVNVGAKYVVISDNIILNNSDFGIIIEQKITMAKAYLTISKNIITRNNNYGIYFNSAYNTISENVISENKYGIFLQRDSNYNVIISNTVKDNTNGIVLHGYHDSNYNTVKSNIIQDNNNGITIQASHSNKIENNTITNNGEYGIFLDYQDYNDPDVYARLTSSNNNITGNFISGQQYGILIELECDNNIICNNNIKDNDWGLYTEVSNNNKIEKNNFIGNTRSAYFKTYWRYDIIFNQNYWDDLNGSSKKQIIGKKAIIPILPPREIQFYWLYIRCFKYDNSPAKESYDIPDIS